MKATGIIIVIAVAAVGGYAGYTKIYAEGENNPYIMRPLDRGSIIQTVSATGTIEPVTKVIVSSQVSGNIKRWYADFNDRVTDGFVLAEIDPDRYETALKFAEAELATARAREEEAQVRYKDAQRESRRIASLRETATASENEALVAKAAEDAALAAWHAAQASVKAAEAALGAAIVDLSRTKIRSPIDGVVISRSIDIGQTVAASLQAPELFVIANDLTKMQVNANVAESDVGLIQEGGPADFRVDAYPGRTFRGKIKQIRYNPTNVESVVTYVTVIEVDNEDLSLRPGMTANITFEVNRADNVLRVPNAALRFNPLPPDAVTLTQGRRGAARPPTVWTMAGREPKPVELKIGITDGAYTEVVEGPLKEGAPVIVERSWKGRGATTSDPTRAMRPPGRV